MRLLGFLEQGRIKKNKVHFKSGELTDSLLAGVGQMVVARHIAPAATVMPHHHRTVLTGQEVAVRLASVPVLIELIKTRTHK